MTHGERAECQERLWSHKEGGEAERGMSKEPSGKQICKKGVLAEPVTSIQFQSPVQKKTAVPPVQND